MNVGETYQDADGTWRVTSGVGRVLIEPSPAFEAKRPPPPEPEQKEPSLAERVAALESLVSPVKKRG